MGANDKSIHYAIVGISTEQFAVVEENYAEDNPNMEIATTLKFGTELENDVLVVGSNFVFQIDSKPFLVIEGHVSFKISKSDWELFKIPDQNKVSVNREFATHLAAIAIGTTRGILHAKTEGTKFNHFVIPSINTGELITSDIEMEEF